ncbi:hypothetical protein TTRE_0000926101 [Trichuris trichiura]|uniref:Uncharacterized protein n=1 Tax=Trichuris trichiura TaxID=36087 RepID=A0A077ZM89_TRITR|nr:hypothetical protein TTRE_0000926101 [Trichuris trichiura]
MVPDEEAALNFLRKKGLLHTDSLCPSCGQAMRLGRGGKAWRCHKRSCDKELCVRTGTWFDDKAAEGAADNIQLESRVHDDQILRARAGAQQGYRSAVEQVPAASCMVNKPAPYLLIGQAGLLFSQRPTS